MPNQEKILLNELEAEVIEQFYKRTVMAICILAIAYIVGLVSFITLLLLKSFYCIFAIIFPLFGYLWLITFGTKYVNNNYGLEKTSAGTIVFKRKRQNGTTYPIIHVVIFLITGIIRLIYEINNLTLIKKEQTTARVNLTKSL